MQLLALTPHSHVPVPTDRPSILRSASHPPFYPLPTLFDSELAGLMLMVFTRTYFGSTFFIFHSCEVVIAEQMHQKKKKEKQQQQRIAF